MRFAFGFASLLERSSDLVGERDRAFADSNTLEDERQAEPRDRPALRSEHRVRAQDVDTSKWGGLNNRAMSCRDGCSDGAYNKPDIVFE